MQSQASIFTILFAEYHYISVYVQDYFLKHFSRNAR